MQATKMQPKELVGGQCSNRPPSQFWVNIFMPVLFFMGIQVYWFYFDHGFLIEAGITNLR